MRVADYIFKELSKYVDTVFYVPGGGAMYLVDALGKSGLCAVSMLHEQGAGFSSIGYAQARRGLGVCLVTSGPGSTNAVTPCLAAWMDSVPVLFISGQAATDTLIGETGLRCRGVQEVDILKVVKPITKYATRFPKYVYELDGKNIIDSLVGTCLDARRGPVWLEVPVDIQGMNYAI